MKKKTIPVPYPYRLPIGPNRVISTNSLWYAFNIGKLINLNFAYYQTYVPAFLLNLYPLSKQIRSHQLLFPVFLKPWLAALKKSIHQNYNQFSGPGKTRNSDYNVYLIGLCVPYNQSYNQIPNGHQITQ